MARIATMSVKYFPVMVDIQGDPKILKAEYYAGDDAGDVLTTIFKLFIWIYGKNGYYMEWGEDDQFVFAKGNGGVQFTDKYKKIVTCLIRSKFFDQHMFEEHKILTSHGIQVQWKKIKDSVKGKGKIKPAYKINSSDDDINSDSDDITSEVITPEEEVMQQSKVKYSKVNKNKVDNTLPNSKNEENNLQTPDQTPSLVPAPKVNPDIVPIDEDNPLPMYQCIDHIFQSKKYVEELYRLCESFNLYKKNAPKEFDFDKLYAWGRSFNRFLNVKNKTIKSWLNHFKNWLAQQPIQINPDELNMKNYERKQSNPKVLGHDQQEARDLLSRPGYYPGDQQPSS